ncbi:hypothetical protein [Paracidovorax avenae]|uniref:hypothetical protein n=1 Tax=Paracidovorax avenae TaxID=80867 RepID=UPI001314229C|nr:hypothetical protein [Paracidovorax avenae]
MVWLLRLCGLLRGRSGKAIALVLAALAGSVAWAACDEWRPVDYLSVGWLGSPESACKGIIAYTSAGAPAGTPPLVFAGLDGDVCLMWRGDPSNKYRMPLEKRSNPSCDSCDANNGKQQTVNFTVGWARSGNADAEDHVGKVTFPRGSVCVQGCTWQVSDTGVAAYRSVVPSPQGLHRLSVDFNVVGDGSKSCTASTDQDKAADPQQPPKECPGYVGEVNGKTVCVGSAAKPVGSPEGPSAGRQSGGGEDTGNPSAGVKPGSGEGSGSGGAGRTPNDGNGSNPGGPAAAVGNGKPNGTTDKPGDGKEQAACGAPGQAKCKIDESGTPDGKNAFDGPGKSLDDAFNKAREQLEGVKSTGDKDTSWGIVPSWLQHGGCTPWVLGTLPLGEPRDIKLDVCAILPYVEAVTSFLWAIGTFVATLAMVFRVTTASKG